MEDLWTAAKYNIKVLQLLLLLFYEAILLLYQEIYWFCNILL